MVNIFWIAVMKPEQWQWTGIKNLICHWNHKINHRHWNYNYLIIFSYFGGFHVYFNQDFCYPVSLWSLITISNTPQVLLLCQSLQSALLPIDLACALCHQLTHFSVFCTNWTISHTHIYHYSTTHCHTANNYTINTVKHYLYTMYMSLFLFLMLLLCCLFFYYYFC